MKRIYLVAVICAIIAGGATYFFASSWKNDNSSEKNNVQVVIALKDVPTGTQITKDNVETYFALKMIDAGAASTNTLTATNDIIGKSATGYIYEGEQVNRSRFEGKVEQSAGLSLEIRKGYVAYSLNANAIQGVDGYILPGDTVDVIGVDKDNKAKVIGTELKVIRVATSNQAASSDGSAEGYVSVTLEIMEDEAQELFAKEIEYGASNLRLVLNKRATEE